MREKEGRPGRAAPQTDERAFYLPPPNRQVTPAWRELKAIVSRAPRLKSDAAVQQLFAWIGSSTKPSQLETEYPTK